MSDRDIGALARIGPEHVERASRLVRSGRTYDLGVELGMDVPAPDRRTLPPFMLMSYRTPEGFAREQTSGGTGSSEYIGGGIHMSSHMDALIHVQHDLKTYGGYDASDIRTDLGWTRYGAETIPPICGRGVLVDAAGHLGVDRLEDGYEVSVAETESCLAAQGVKVGAGDVVLVRTGKITQFGHDNQAFQSKSPGISRDAAIWLYDQGMAAIGADCLAVEAYPYPDPEHSLHRAMIVDRGVHLIENLWLEDLARDRVYEFLFVCLPLKIVGATGSWVRPVAIA